MTPSNHVIDRQSKMNRLPEYECIEYIKAWYLWADTLLYHRALLHEMYGIYCVIYITVAYHMVILSAHNTHYIPFNTDPCTYVSFSISISLWFHRSFCFLPNVNVSASFHELQTAYIIENYYHVAPISIESLFCNI